MKLQIRNRRVRLPKFRIPKVGVEVRLPGFSLAIPRLITRVTIGGQFKKMVGVSFTIAALVVVIAVTFAVVGVEQAKTFPMAAEYTMDERTTNVPIGLDPSSDSPETQTLKLNIGGARINNIIIDDINVGNDVTIEDQLTVNGNTVLGNNAVSDSVVINGGLSGDNASFQTVTIQNLTVTGQQTIVNTSDLTVEDRFILLGSGSTANIDTGIVFGSGSRDGTANSKALNAIFLDNSVNRFGLAVDVNPNSSDTPAQIAENKINGYIVSIRSSSVVSPNLSALAPNYGYGEMVFLNTLQEKKKIKEDLVKQKLNLTQLNENELQYLLSLIARSDFKGTDIQIMYNITAKLQNQLIDKTKKE